MAVLGEVENNLHLAHLAFSQGDIEKMRISYGNCIENILELHKQGDIEDISPLPRKEDVMKYNNMEDFMGVWNILRSKYVPFRDYS